MCSVHNQWYDISCATLFLMPEEVNEASPIVYEPANHSLAFQQYNLYITSAISE